MAESNIKANAQNGDKPIADNRRVRYFIGRLASQRTWLNVGLQDTTQRFRSLTLDYDENGDDFVIDELFPRSSKSQLEVGQILRIVAQVDGGRMSFVTHVRQCDVDENGPSYRCSLPADVRILQRREAHRVIVGLRTSIPVEIHAETGFALKPLVGHLFDISMGGMCISFDRYVDSIRTLAEEHANVKARVKLPNGERFEAKLDFTHTNDRDIPASCKVGAQFGELQPEQIRELTKFVMQCERDSARRQRELALEAQARNNEAPATPGAERPPRRSDRAR